MSRLKNKLLELFVNVDLIILTKFIATYLLPILLSVTQFLIERTYNSFIYVAILTGTPTTISYVLLEFIDYFYDSTCKLDPFYLSFLLLFTFIDLITFMVYLLIGCSIMIGYIICFMSVLLFILTYKLFD